MSIVATQREYVQTMVLARIREESKNWPAAVRAYIEQVTRPLDLPGEEDWDAS